MLLKIFYLAFTSVDTPCVFCILVSKFHGQGKLDLKDVAVVCAKLRRPYFVNGLYVVHSIFSSCRVGRIDSFLLPPSRDKHLHE